MLHQHPILILTDIMLKFCFSISGKSLAVHSLCLGSIAYDVCKEIFKMGNRLVPLRDLTFPEVTWVVEYSSKIFQTCTNLLGEKV